MFRFFLAGILSLFTTLSLPAQTSGAPLKGAVPDWVRPISMAGPNDSLRSAGSQLLLFDKQVNFEQQSFYWHYAILMENSEAVQQHSQISVSYDSSFQELTWHRLLVYRDGKVIDKLAGQLIREYRREEGLERGLYDGRITAVIDLHDIRQGDLLEYSYSLSGRNPAFADHAYSYLNLQFGIPVGRLHFSLLIPKGRELTPILMGGAQPPSIRTLGAQREYHWDLEMLPALESYEHLPAGFRAGPAVALTDFKDWSEVVRAVEPMYRFSLEEERFLREEARRITGGKLGEEAYLSLLRFVQDDIRYLGFEDGLNAYRPHSVKQVMKQRYGDCKDKSHLLVGLLRAAGAKAYPMLVNTRERSYMNEDERSPYNFDHCTVALSLEGQWVFIDPTISGQGGNLRDYVFPNYGKGLILSPGVDSLTEISAAKGGSISVMDHVNISVDERVPSSLRVETVFRGEEADKRREYYLGTAANEITGEFVDYYQGFFPHLRSSAPLEVQDNRFLNELKTVEYYEIDSLWDRLEDGRRRTIFYTTHLNELVQLEKDPQRKAPFPLAYPLKLEHDMILQLPFEWLVEEQDFKLEAPEYRYLFAVRAQPSRNRIYIRHHYSTQAAEVKAADYGRTVRDHNKIADHLGYQLYDPDSKRLASATDPLGTILMALLFCAASIFSILLMRRIHQSFDPLPPRWAKGKKNFGGWLILPMIGLLLTPLVMLFRMILSWDESAGPILGKVINPDNDLFNPDLFILFTIDFIGRIVIFSFVILCLVQFFKRRSSLPRLMVVFYLINLLWPILMVGLTFVLENAVYEIDESELRGPILGCIIWIPYFTRSQRVKETFNRRLSGDYGKGLVNDISVERAQPLVLNDQKLGEVSVRSEKPARP